MGIEVGGGGKCFPASWVIPPKPCDSCRSAVALLFCRVDSAFLCMGCDAKIHRSANSRHERVWMCEVCEQAPASVTCKADAAALCVTCDRDIHSANPLSRRHERFPVAPFYDTAESVVKSAAASAFLVPAGDETTAITIEKSIHTSEITPPSWVLHNPTTKLPADMPDMKSVDVLFSDSDQFLDLDYPIVSIHSSGTDSVVPVQPLKSVEQTTQLMNQSSDNYVEFDFNCAKLNSYNNNNRYTAQSISHSLSSSSMDAGEVPDGSSMSEISYPFGRNRNYGGDLGGSANSPPCMGTDRKARVLRYREKRKNRKFEKTIRYASRKAYAETRPRIKGRFAKRAEVVADVVDRRHTSGGSGLIAEVAGYGVVPLFL